MRRQAGTIVRWPIWSWRNLFVTTSALLLVVYAMGSVVGSSTVADQAAPASTPTAAATTTSAAPPTTTSSTVAAATPPTTTTAKPPPEGSTIPGTTVPTSAGLDTASSESVTQVATAFAGAWSASGRSQLEWTRGIQPFVTAALAAGLAQTDPARVPATKVTGEALLVSASAISAQVRVPTDGGGIVVTLGRAASGPWKVSDVAPAAQPPGASTPDLGRSATGPGPSSTGQGPATPGRSPATPGRSPATPGRSPTTSPTRS